MASGGGTLTASEVARAGIHGQQLSRLVREGRLERVTRGLYRIPDRPVSEHHGLVLSARSVPRGVCSLRIEVSRSRRPGPGQSRRGSLSDQVSHGLGDTYDEDSCRTVVVHPPARPG